jgi:2'-5' RNA ligase
MTDSPTLRLFTALWPEPEVRAQLAAHRDGWTWPASARRVADEKLHATLHFIGGFPRDDVVALGEALGDVRMDPLTLAPASTEVWRGGIAVLTLGGDPALTALHERIGAVLGGFGVALDARPFAPHVTLARKAWHAKPPAARPAIAWAARSFSLVASLPGRGGATYAVLSTWSAIVSG